MSNVFLPIGGGDEIGASSYFVQLNGDNFLLDSGIRLHSEYKHPRIASLYERELIDHLSFLEAILISHAHLDHIGSLPTIVTEARKVPVYATSPTKDIMELQLKSAKSDETFFDVQAVREFNQERVQSALSSVKPTPWNQHIPLGNCQVSFFPAGHILGAAMIYIESDVGNILFTGDFTPFDQQTVDRYQIPDGLVVDLLVTESTYGYEESGHTDHVDAEREIFAGQIEQCLAENGWVLIPAFAIGRSQEIALILQNLICEGRLKPFPIYIDGLAQRVCAIYEKNGIKIFNENIRKAPRNLIRNLDAFNGVIIASSGMLLDRSASARYAEKLLPNPLNALFFSGYLDEESPGGSLELLRKSRGKSFRLNGKTLFVEATVDTYRLSAHTDNKGILALIEKVEAEMVIFVHGKPPRKSSKIDVYRETCRQFKDKTRIYQAFNGMPIYF